MCEIIAYVGKDNALAVLLDVLERLEYRGYDSAGIAFQNGKGIEVYRGIRKIREFQSALRSPLPPARLGLGHVRWSTYVEASPQNAHPQSCGGVVVVHNGIIENLDELESLLIAAGQKLPPDGEVIPRVISRYLVDGLSPAEACKKLILLLRGTYALVIACESHPDTLFAVKSGVPLAVAPGEGEYVLASDIGTLLPYSRKCIFLKDKQLCILRPAGVELKTLGWPQDIPAGDTIRELQRTGTAIEKEGYHDFMLKEVHEQPKALMDTLSEWVDDPLRLLEELGIVRLTKRFRRLHIVGCGTSYHAALLGRYIIEKFLHIPVTADIASEYSCMNPIITKGTLFISLTQSGETADIITAQREAKEKGAHVFTICNIAGSTAAREADSVLYTRAGPGRSKVPTKTFAAQLAALFLLGVAVGTAKGRLIPLETETLKSLLKGLPCLIAKALGQDEKIREIAGTMIHARQILYLGSGINYPVALEGALKMKEVAHIPAEGYPAGEINGGPIELVQRDVPVIIMAPLDSLHEKVLPSIREVTTRGGRIVALTDAPAALKDKVANIIGLPPAHPALSPFVSIVPLQLLAYHVATGKGCPVDLPPSPSRSKMFAKPLSR